MEVDDPERESLERRINLIANNRLTRLFDLWRTIGLNIEETRVKEVEKLVQQLFDDMVTEEERSLDRITKKIQQYEKERLEIARDLKIDCQRDDSLEAALSLIDVEFKLRIEVHQLRERKNERLQQYSQLSEEEKSLSSMTGSFSLSDGIIFDRVPSEDQILEVKNHIVQLKKLRRERETEFQKIRKEITDLLERLEVEPNTTFEREIICEALDKITLSERTIELTKSVLEKLQEEVEENKVQAVEMIERMQSISENLKIPSSVTPSPNDFYSATTISALKEQLKALEIKRLEHLPLFIKNSGDELEQIWNNCFVDDSTKSAFYVILESKDGDEEILSHYEETIKVWKNYHSTNKLLLDKVKEWFLLWEDRVELETCTKDPSRLGNYRALREEERRRNRVNKRFPKLVSEIEALCVQYQKQNKKDFMIEGRSFYETSKIKEENHAAEVQKEKERKKEERKQMMVQETIYGAQPRRGTPIKKNLTAVKRLKNSVKTVKTTVTTPPKTPRINLIKATPIRNPTSSNRRLSGRTPKRKPLIDLNESYVSGSDAGQTPIADVKGNIFRNANIISSTLKTDELRVTVPKMQTRKRIVVIRPETSQEAGRKSKRTRKIPKKLSDYDLTMGEEDEESLTGQN